jgi:hypothetical protein
MDGSSRALNKCDLIHFTFGIDGRTVAEARVVRTHCTTYCRGICKKVATTRTCLIVVRYRNIIL